MKKTISILMLLVCIACLIVLFIAQMDLVPDNPFIEYRLIIGIVFIALTGFMKIDYKRLKKIP